MEAKLGGFSFGYLFADDESVTAEDTVINTS
jgi:hypothetical protein